MDDPVGMLLILARTVWGAYFVCSSCAALVVANRLLLCRQPWKAVFTMGLAGLILGVWIVTA